MTDSLANPRRRPSRRAAPQPTVSIADLSPAQACQLGSAVGGLLNNGLPRSRAIEATQTIAEFIRRGQRAQAAVNAILADHERARTKPRRNK